jgi:cell filamentation protein
LGREIPDGAHLQRRQPFCFPEHITSSMDRLFPSLLNGRCLEAETADEFVTSAATFLAELNAIHPFREGNGRSQLAFLDLLGESAGFRFDFSRVDRDTFLGRYASIGRDPTEGRPKL